MPLQLDFSTALMQFAAGEVQFENAEAREFSTIIHYSHRAAYLWFEDIIHSPARSICKTPKPLWLKSLTKVLQFRSSSAAVYGHPAS